MPAGISTDCNDTSSPASANEAGSYPQVGSYNRRIDRQQA